MNLAFFVVHANKDTQKKNKNVSDDSQKHIKDTDGRRTAAKAS